MHVHPITINAITQEIVYSSSSYHHLLSHLTLVIFIKNDKKIKNLSHFNQCLQCYFVTVFATGVHISRYYTHLDQDM